MCIEHTHAIGDHLLMLSEHERGEGEGGRGTCAQVGELAQRESEKC